MLFSNKNLTFVLITTLITSCSSQVSTLNNEAFNAKMDRNLNGSPPPDPNYKAPDVKDEFSPSETKEVFSAKDSKKFIEPTFDTLPPEELEHSDDQITVIFKNNYKVRWDKSAKKDRSLAGNDLSELETLFSDSGLILGYSLDIGKTEKELDDIQENYKKNTGVDIPHVSSIHYYRFSPGVDVKQLCKKLMQYPFIRLAYPAPKYKNQATVSSALNTSGALNPAPNDIFVKDSFGNNTTEVYYQFRAHKVPEAWNYYGSNVGSTMPKLAVIDAEGFLPSTSEINYIPNSGYNISSTGTVINGTGSNPPSPCTNNSCVSSSVTSPHGNAVTAVAAGKRNNGLGTAGIAQGAQVLPLKIDVSGTAAIESAIYRAANDTRARYI